MQENKVDQAILKELTTVLYRNLTIGLLAVMLQSLVLFWLLYGYVESNYLIVWYVILTLNSLGGFIVISWYRRTQHDQSLLRSHYYGYILGSSITAIMLGIIGSILMPVDVPHQALVMIAIIGITGAAVQNLHASYLASGCFLSFSLFPLLMWQFLQILKGQPIFIGIFILTLCYSAYLAIDVKTGYVTLANNIKLKLDNLYLSMHDSLTGLYNRYSLKDTLHRLMVQSKRDHSKVSIILFDIDYFKNINDDFGHDVGDIVIYKISQFIQNFFSETDFTFRYGGEEFLIILDGVDCQAAMQKADDFRALINKSPIQLTSQTRKAISISSGVATYPDHGDSADILIKMADKALYRAKNSGRNQVYSASYEI